MASPSTHPAAQSADGPPLVPLALWAIAVLAYPLYLLFAMLATPGLAAEAASTLPQIIVDGILRLPLALLSTALWGAAIGFGSLLLRKTGFAFLTPGERAVFGGAIGMGVLSLGTFSLGTLFSVLNSQWAILNSRSLAPLFLLAVAAFGLRDLLALIKEGARGLAAWRREARWLGLVTVALGALVVLFALTRANVPVVADYDALEYHLAAPAQWWRAGHVSFLPYNVYTDFPLVTEMLYLLAMACTGGPMLGALIGQQVGVGFVVLTAAGIAACGRRLHSGSGGPRRAPRFFLATPMLPGLATLNSYLVELPMTAYSLLALFAFLLLKRSGQSREGEDGGMGGCMNAGEDGRAPDSGSDIHPAIQPSNLTGSSPSWRCAILCGTMIGLAIGCKYTAVLFVLLPILGFVFARGIVWLDRFPRALAETAVVGAAALAVASPWLARNAVDTGNPTYPLLYHVFDGRHWSPEQDAKFAKAHSTEDGSTLDVIPSFGARFWRFALWRDQPDGGVANPPAPALLLLFGLIPLAMGNGRFARLRFYLAIAFLLAAATRQFVSPDVYGELTLMIFLLGVFGLVIGSAYMLCQGDAVYLALHFTLWLIAWNALTHAIDRFLDPATAAIAVLAGLGLAAIPRGWPRRIADCLVPLGLAYAVLTAFLLHAVPLAAGLAMPTRDFLEEAFKGSTYCQPAMDAINANLPKDATVLFVGESRAFYCQRRVIAPTVFDRNPIDEILSGQGRIGRMDDWMDGRKQENGRTVSPRNSDSDSHPAIQPSNLSPETPERRVRDGLRALGITHVYVDWPEADRLSRTYGFRYGGRHHDGFSDHITPDLFARMAALGYLRPLGGTAGPAAQPAFALYELP